MKKLVILSAALLTLSTAQAAPAADTSDKVFLPTVISYMDGNFVNLTLADTPMDDLHECLEKLQRLIAGAMEHGDIPQGGAVLGACVPAPRHHGTG